MPNKRSRYATGTEAKLYSIWRQNVYIRDRHTCQMPECKKWGGKLEAHHIKKWADNPKIRFAVSNGITLCHACHKKINGIEEQYEELFQTIIAKKYGQ